MIVGAGNAAMCAALSARESGAEVAILGRAPIEESGGNSRFTEGAIRCVYDGVDDLRRLMPDLTDQEIADTDFGTYTDDQFFDDMGRVTQYRCDPDLVETKQSPSPQRVYVAGGSRRIEGSLRRRTASKKQCSKGCCVAARLDQNGEQPITWKI